MSDTLLDTKIDFQKNPTQINQSYQDEDIIDLREIFAILYKRRILIIALTFLMTLMALIYVKLLPNQYTATVVIAPVTQEQNGLKSSLGGLASLAGVQLGATASPTQNNLARLKGRDFTYKFLEDNQLIPLLFGEDYEAIKNKPKERQLWAAYNIFNAIRSIKEDKKTGVIEISIQWFDAKQAADWANLLVKEMNEEIRLSDVTSANLRLKYLQEKLKSTKEIDLQEVTYNLIENEMKTVMLADVNVDYAFKILDKAIVPEEKSGPARSRMLILYSLVSCLISVALVYILDFLAKIKK